MPTGAKIQVIWPNPDEPRATLVRKTAQGRLRERVVGPRALLTIDEAAAVLERPAEHVRRAIEAHLLRPVRRGGRRYVTMRTCAEFRREEQSDLAVARARLRDPVRPAEEVYRQLGI